MSSRLRFRLYLIIGALALVVPLLPTGQTAFAAGNTHWVNDDGSPPVPPGTSCQNRGYSSIQAAVNAANAGDRINVCPGTYTETVVVPSTKSNIVLRSTSLWQAVIQAPLTIAADLLNFKSIVRVTGATNVTILGFTITGPGPAGCDSIRFGVRVDGGGQANILGNHITKIRDTPFSGCQNGVAVQVGRQVDMTTGSANILGNWIDDYQKNGMTIDNAGSFAYVAANRVVGAGPTIVIAQNGVQVSRGAGAKVEYNFIANHLYSPQTVASTGVLLFQPAGVTTSKNSLSANDVGVDVISPTAAGQTSRNYVRSSSFDAVALDPANGHSVYDNRIDQNDGPGIGVYGGSQNNKLERNDVERNGDSGILLSDNANSNIVRQNHVRSNGFADTDSTDGIRAEIATTGNTIDRNYMRDNFTHDCHDDSGVPVIGPPANFWTGNHGKTQNIPGLCKPASHQDDYDDDHGYQMTAASAGWNPGFAWQTDYPLAVDYDWATAYSAIDTQSLLSLLPSVGSRRPAASPQR